MRLDITLTTKKAVEIGSQTLVGGFGNFPRDFGNCFSVLADDGNYYNIVNFIVENLEELIRIEAVTFPINIEILNDSKAALINDTRIPDEWYRVEWCSTCCPRGLLPLSQQLAFNRRVDRGEIKVTPIEINGKKAELISQKITPKVNKKGKWTVETEMENGIVYAPYIPVVRKYEVR